MTERMDYQAFYALVSDLVTNEQTCTLFGRTDTNHSVIIGIDAGDITCIRCGPKRGGDAIGALREMQSGSFRVDEALIELRSPELPPTAQLLADLHPAAEAPAAAAPDTAATDSGHGRHTEQAKLLCDLLSRYVGPVAPLLCAEEIKAAGGLDSQHQLDRILKQLAREIDNSHEATEFVSTAYRELSHLLIAAVPSAAATVSTPAIDERQAVKALCSIVTDYLGPVAPIVCEEKISEAGGLHDLRQLQAVIHALAQEISERNEADRFVVRAHTLFGISKG